MAETVDRENISDLIPASRSKVKQRISLGLFAFEPLSLGPSTYELDGGTSPSILR
jgi:hypothetical protein